MSAQRISELMPGVEGRLLEVRIIRKWKTFNRNDLYFVFVDIDGNAIEAIAESKVASTFDSVLNVNHCYSIVDYICTTARVSLRTVFTNALTRLGKTTTIQPIQNTHIPYHYFKFASFEEVEARINKTDYLTDFIGYLHDAYRRTLANNQQVIKMILKHESGNNINVTLWEEIAKDINLDSIRNMQPPVIIAITSTKVTSFKGTPIFVRVHPI